VKKPVKFKIVYVCVSVFSSTGVSIPRLHRSEAFKFASTHITCKRDVEQANT